MRLWGGKKREKRTAGDYSDSVLRILEAQALEGTANTGATAATEAASGLLARALASATIEGENWLAETISAEWLAQVGRDLIRRGESLHVIDLCTETGRVFLLPQSTWNWEGGTDRPDTWRVRCTGYGPSNSTTRYLSQNGVVFLRWGASPGTLYRGTSPLSWASLTAKTQAESERSIGDELGGPIAQIIPLPSVDVPDPTDENTNDPLAVLKTKIGKARGNAVMVETTAAGYGEGMTGAPRKDWIANRLGPNFQQPLVEAAKTAYQRMLSACGASSPLFDDSDGTAKREALRQYFLMTVQPFATLIAQELTKKLGTTVTLKFDLYALDLAGRAQAFQKLVQSGMSIEQALGTTGLLVQDAA